VDYLTEVEGYWTDTLAESIRMPSAFCGLREFEFERETPPPPSMLTSLDNLLNFRLVVGLLALYSRLLYEVKDSAPRFVTGGLDELNIYELATVLDKV
jgi:hypothetical protein